jgi:hypothetical protein
MSQLRICKKTMIRKRGNKKMMNVKLQTKICKKILLTVQELVEL